MSARAVRLGSPRKRGEGLRLGAVRRPPRGVRKADYAGRDLFDLWLPELAPSAPLVAWYYDKPLTDERWARYIEKYRREMRAPAKERLLQVLAALSQRANFSVACYCEREDRCHRSILRELLREHGGKVVDGVRRQPGLP
jgi:uncharacterized protein YeaO (DUF488 family)